jgi:hypothetical protein
MKSGYLPFYHLVETPPQALRRFFLLQLVSRFRAGPFGQAPGRHVQHHLAFGNSRAFGSAQAHAFADRELAAVGPAIAVDRVVARDLRLLERWLLREGRRREEEGGDEDAFHGGTSTRDGSRSMLCLCRQHVKRGSKGIRFSSVGRLSGDLGSHFR